MIKTTGRQLSPLADRGIKMKSLQHEISVLVKNKPIQEYEHEGSTFIEGRNGTPYIIRLKNNNYKKAVFVVSVDGLSILDGKECSNSSPGYVLNPYQTLDIECYKVDSETGAKFIFGTKEASYSSVIGKGVENTGVIAALVFNEKERPVQIYATKYSKSYSPARSATRSFGASVKGLSSSNSWEQTSLSDIGYNSNQSMSLSASGSLSNSTMNASASITPPDPGLGTVFGEAMKWQTHSVTFEREGLNPNSTLVLFYDTKKNLEHRGIKFSKPAPIMPNPFPGNKGCEPPKNWKGGK